MCSKKTRLISIELDLQHGEGKRPMYVASGNQVVIKDYAD